MNSIKSIMTLRYTERLFNGCVYYILLAVSLGVVYAPEAVADGNGISSSRLVPLHLTV